MEEIRPELEKIVAQLENSGIKKVEIGSINLGSGGSPLQDRSDGRGYRIYAKNPERNDQNFGVVVDYPVGLATFGHLRNHLMKKKIRYVEGIYELPLRIPENATETRNRT